MILTIMTRQQFPKQTGLLETLMEEEFKELFFPFKSGESSSAPVPATERTDGPGVQLSLPKSHQHYQLEKLQICFRL